MDLLFDSRRADCYKSASQKIRILSEHWVSENFYCPNCGAYPVYQYPNNTPVADFYCRSCRENFELKSFKNRLGKKVVDGAYGTMLKRLAEESNPNFLLLNYDQYSLSVENMLVIPKHFFTSDIIEPRTPLALSARRAGWVGCNILLDSIPSSGRIFIVKDRALQSRREVLADWHKLLFLRAEGDTTAKKWLIAVIRCIEDLKKDTFSLSDLYRFESKLRIIFPYNHHIKAKIRQKLQILRDNGYLRFIGRGHYELSSRI